MFRDRINNVNVVSEKVLLPPSALKTQLPQTEKTEQTISKGREVLTSILDKRDPRLFVVTGPCSIHDMDAAKEYAQRLKVLHDEMEDTLYLVMRVYFEKPRTTIGWKGFINDPYLNDSFHIEEGLAKARELLLWIAELGLPSGTEALDPITPQYMADLFSWAAIGARTTESQTHRELASGLSMPVGFKNGTDGSLGVAINAMHSAAAPHHFLGINQNGQATVLQTRGNPYGHVILRGGNGQTNYDSVNIGLCETALKKAALPINIVVDCSHGNSHKDHHLQSQVADNVFQQVVDGNRSIVGLMLESHLHEGNQPMQKNPQELRYGVSITDACMDWENTEKLLRKAYQDLRPIIAARRAEMQA